MTAATHLSLIVAGHGSNIPSSLDGQLAAQGSAREIELKFRSK